LDGQLINYFIEIKNLVNSISTIKYILNL